MFQGNHFNTRGVGHIQGCNDATQALQVVGIVCDHQRIGARIDVDGVIGADERTQNGHQVVGVFVVELKNLRHDLTVGGRHCASRYTPTLHFGIGLGYHQIQTSRFNQRKTLRAQLGCKQAKRLRWRHRHIAGEVDGAFDAGVDHHIVARQGGQSFGHGIDLCIVEIQGDGFGCLLAGGIGFFGGLGCLCLCLCLSLAGAKHQRQTDAIDEAQPHQPSCQGLALREIIERRLS